MKRIVLTILLCFSPYLFFGVSLDFGILYNFGFNKNYSFIYGNESDLGYFLYMEQKIKIKVPAYIGIKYRYFSDKGKLQISQNDTYMRMKQIGIILGFLIFEKGGLNIDIQGEIGGGKLYEENYMGSGDVNFINWTTGCKILKSLYKVKNIKINYEVGVDFNYLTYKELSFSERKDIYYFSLYSGLKFKF